MWCLGISGGYYHDASACLFKDDKLIVKGPKLVPLESGKNQGESDLN